MDAQAVRAEVEREWAELRRDFEELPPQPVAVLLTRYMRAWKEANERLQQCKTCLAVLQRWYKEDPAKIVGAVELVDALKVQLDKEEMTHAGK